MKKVFLIAILFISTIAFCNSLNMTFFGEKQYKQALDKYSQSIHDGNFSAYTLLEEVGKINSKYVNMLLSDLLEQLKVKAFFNKEKDYSKDKKMLEKAIVSNKSHDSVVQDFTTSPIWVTQFIAKRAYISDPYHYPITDWSYSTSEVEPFSVGIKGSRESSSYFQPGFEQAYSNWYRLLLKFDLSSLPTGINVIDSYIKLDGINSHWGVGEEGGMSCGILSTTEVSSFSDLDKYGMTAPFRGKLFGYGTSHECLKFSDVSQFISSCDGTDNEGAVVINFQKNSGSDTHDYGNRFYASNVYRSKIKLVIRYEIGD